MVLPVRAEEGTSAILMPDRSKIYVNTVIAAGLVMFVNGLAPWRLSDPQELLTYILLAAIAGTWTIRGPGAASRELSPGVVVTIAGIVNLPLPQVLATGSAAILAEAIWHRRSGRNQMGLKLHGAVCALSAMLAYDIAHLPLLAKWNCPELTAVVGAATLLSVHTGLLAGARSLQESRSFRSTFAFGLRSLAPYGVAGAAAGALVAHLKGSIDWRAALIVLVPMFVIYLYYRHFVELRA